MGSDKWHQTLLDCGELYVVGGAVRDRLLDSGTPVPDTDYLVTGIPPGELEELLDRLGTVLLVGKSFGVYKFTPRGETVTYDIAYPRRESSTGPGHRDFHVEFDWNLPVEADLSRRDFTINAIALNLRDEKIIDPCGGREDIKQRLLRMVFPAAFEEDPLRILRGARFYARFDLAIDDATRQAMPKNVELLGTLSAERIQEEFSKMFLQCSKPSTGLVLLQELGALKVILPELDRSAGVTQNEYHPDDVFVHSLKSLDSAPQDMLAVRWAALLHDLGKVDCKQTVDDPKTGERVVFYGHEKESANIARQVLKRFRYGNALVQHCESLVLNHMFDYQPEWSDATVRRFIRRIGESNLPDQFLLREADCLSRDLFDSIAELAGLKGRVAGELSKNRALKVTDLAVDGRDLIEKLNIPEGPAVGEILNQLLEAVVADPSLNTKGKLFELVRQIRP
jgi:tRNA nucleotidyltransferase (CCA-adding enzyme)